MKQPIDRIALLELAASYAELLSTRMAWQQRVSTCQRQLAEMLAAGERAELAPKQRVYEAAVARCAGIVGCAPDRIEGWNLEDGVLVLREEPPPPQQT